MRLTVIVTVLFAGIATQTNGAIYPVQTDPGRVVSISLSRLML
ncbi:hypothetical protein C8J36_1155 [Rhizobium sp. PP-F2F-G48]|nr:hypothetical protein [Rhizobium sp. PP-F2F-G48]TCM47394.1 hypothetical protein C8J36_1155 [Rhizobium sp. PP-F2F-G48]